MIYDGTIFDTFRDIYEVRTVDTQRECPAFFSTNASDRYYNRGDDAEVKIIMTGRGFQKMMDDLFRPSERAQFFKPVFDVDKLDIDDKTPLVAKYDLQRHDVATIKMLFDKLAEAFPERKIIAVPKGVDIEMLGAEGLTEIRDYLTEVINSLDYDNIMGF